jgi:hypothetical protein
MSQQRTKADQQQTCCNNEQKQINNKHVATMSQRGSTTDILQQPIEPDQQADMTQQPTEPD